MRQPLHNFCSLTLGLGLITSAVGCGGGDSLPREPISGTVTLDGKPLEKGRIRFLPAAEGNASTSTEADIISGTYEVPASTGLMPGPYQVMISAVEEIKSPSPASKARRVPGYDPEGGTGVEDSPADVRVRETLPSKYNTQSTLKAEVIKGGNKPLDFALTSQ